MCFFLIKVLHYGIMAKTTTYTVYSFRVSYWARLDYLQNYHYHFLQSLAYSTLSQRRTHRNCVVKDTWGSCAMKKWLHHLLTRLSCLFFNVLFWGLPVLLSHIRAFKTGLGRCDAWASFRVQGRLPDGPKIALMSEWGEMAAANDRSLLPVPFVLFRTEALGKKARCDYMF